MEPCNYESLNVAQCLTRYMDSAFREVHGWVSPAAISVLAASAESCRRAGISGGVCEIGVHHGRFFLALLAVANPRQRSLAIDLFADQLRNVDSSGLGSEADFTNNLKKYNDYAEQVSLLSIDSLAINLNKIAELHKSFGEFLFFSVDGGHTSTHAYNDLLVAAELTNPGGAIILDDFFHPSWPGVTEGLFKYLQSGNAKFVPYCIGGGKLFLTSLGFADERLKFVSRYLKQGLKQSFVKTVKLFGHTCLDFRLVESDPLPR